MKKILITLFLMTGLSFLFVNAQKPLKKPAKQQNTQTATIPKKQPTSQQHAQRRNTEAQRKRKAEEQRRREAEEQRQREAEEQRQREAEEQRLREAEEQRLREAEAQRQREAEEKCKKLTGTINGHEYVDLGLSVKWATCNVGASSPSDYGDYFAWGETTTKSKYTSGKSTTWKKKVDNISGNPRYDVARANWGGTWRMPTSEEINELRNKCKCKWTTQGGHNGYLITGPNDNSIFLPATGHRYDSLLSGIGENGNYWSSSPYWINLREASFLYISNHDFYQFYGFRHCGRTVRPVSE